MRRHRIPEEDPIADRLFTIRLAVAADVPAMHRVRCAVRENALTDPTRVTEASYTKYIAAHAAWVAVTTGDEITGFAALDAGDASIWALFVAPDSESVGIGRALHDALIGGARRCGLTALSLVTASETRAERFYERAGWTKLLAATPGVTRFERTLHG